MTTSPVISGYELDALLGAGTTGSVWQGRAADGAAVAVKVADPTPTAEATIRAEGALLARLTHPGLVSSRGLVDAGGRVALVLDLVPGGTLADRLARRTRLTPAEVVELGVALAATLEHLHREGVVHGDVKPENVLIDADGRPVLGDLGTAAGPDVTGTPGYATAQVEAGVPPGPAADVHALAVVLHESLAGRLPVDGVPLERAAPGTPPGLVAVVELALAGGIPSAGALGAALATADTGGVAAPRAGTRSFGPRPPRPAPDESRRIAERLRRLVPVAAAAVAAAVLAGPFSPWRSGDVASAASPELHLVTRPAVEWDGAVLTAADGTRYTLGVTGGQVVLGDWDCDGRRTPAHYDPATGAAVLFPEWASGGVGVGGRELRLPAGATAAVARHDGCDRLVVTD